MSTSLLCFEILLDAAALISPELVSPDDVTLESRVSFTTWNKIVPVMVIRLGKLLWLKLMTETDLKDKLTLLFELLEDPFAADDVETVIEGVTLELYE